MTTVQRVHKRHFTMESYDFVIVGGGSAGCILAERLTRSGRHRVLLIEAGGSDWSPWISLPLGYGKLFHHPPEFWEAEQALVPWKSASWGWMVLAFWEVIKTDIPNECTWVKKSWRNLQKYPYPGWQMILNDHERYSNKQGQMKSLMESL